MIGTILRAFWGDLNTPSSFPNDPQGALTNQIGHLALGAFLAAFISLIYCAMAGEMPFRWAVWAGVSAAYLVMIEWLKQDWQKADSLIDGAFVSLGAAAPLAALKEVSFQPKVALEPQPEQGLAVLAVCLVALAAYVYPRAVRKWKERGSIGQ